MLVKRIIPCLDIKDGRTVKGVNFINLRDAGDPIELAKKYSQSGADELVFLDISATEENRGTLLEMVNAVAREINIPFTVGGGIRSVEDANAILKAGADKVAINSAAVRKPELLNELSQRFGNQCIVLAVDAKRVKGEWKVFLVGGKQETEIGLFDWVKEVEKRGAGEILFTSMENDGVKSGFALAALDKISREVNIPLIASGGAGQTSDFIELFNKTNADGALAASVFHNDEIEIQELKENLNNAGISVRK